jgi:pyruvate/2-oxoglutarate dehydrogenase complex dihydrolipoamide acyltransferase (E2) component
MVERQSFHKIPFSPNRQMVAASSAASRRYNTIHSLLEIDVTEPRRLIRIYEEQTSRDLSFTGYLVRCLAETIKDFPEFNAFRKGKSLILLDDLTISVLVERELQGDQVPEPVGIQKAQEKDLLQIQQEIRAAQSNPGDQLGDLSGMSWIRFLPTWLLGAFVRLASRNITLAGRYGKVAVTAVGMFSAPRNWLIPLSSATVLLTVGGIHKAPVLMDGQLSEAEYLQATLSFDHDLIDGAPAARFGNRFSGVVSSGELLKMDF